MSARSDNQMPIAYTARSMGFCALGFEKSVADSAPQLQMKNRNTAAVASNAIHGATTRYIGGLVHPSAASPVIAATESVVAMFLSICKLPNAEVSDGGGNQAPGFANGCRPPPFARPKS